VDPEGTCTGEQLVGTYHIEPTDILPLIPIQDISLLVLVGDSDVLVLLIHLAQYPTTRCQGTLRRGFSARTCCRCGVFFVFVLLLDMGAVFVFGASLLLVDAIILLMLIRTNIHL
jgi:hypothetical protein